MKNIFLCFAAGILAACTADKLPENIEMDKPGSGGGSGAGTEKVTIDIRIATPSTRAIIDDPGAGAASFAWENGDEIGVVVDGKYRRFTLSGKSGDGTGTFTAELPAGSVVADGAEVAYPYIDGDYDEGTRTFRLTYPAEYTSTKEGDFRHRWAGTLVKDGNAYKAVLAHQTAILRVTYDNVPADATAIRLTADRAIAGSSNTITTTFSWHASTMNFYFPVPEGTYSSFTAELLGGTETIDESRKSMANGSMVLETGKIYRTPSIGLGAKKVLVAYFSFTNTTKAIAESMAGILGADLYRITPTEAYTPDNSNYYDASTRAYQEQYGPASARPGIDTNLSGTDYDTVLLGFPIWYGKVPRVVLSFLDAYDFSGKTVIPFCTSGSSSISGAQTELRNTYSGIDWKNGARLNGYTDEQLTAWLARLGVARNASTIRLTIGGTVFTADLADNATARAFGNLLPMTLSMSELNGNEKYHYLDTTLPTDASCPGTIHTGDIMLYGNNCIVVFYKTFDTRYNYTKIGRITDPSALEKALGSGTVEVRFGR